MESNVFKDRAIEVAESVLYSREELTNLMNKKGKYSNKDVSSLIRIINIYMDIVRTTMNDLGEDLFDTINKLNDIYGVDKHYSYLDYLKKDNSINKKVIIKILCDPLYFRLFDDFDNNKDIFQKSKQDYLLAIDSFVTSLQMENRKLSDIANKRFRHIMKKNALSYKRRYLLPGDIVTCDNLDKDLEESIMSKIDMNNDSFTIARSIYVELCKTVNYDMNYVLYDLDSDEIRNRSLVRSVDNINLHDSDIICVTWANIYATLLNKNHIRAMVCGEVHKYVVFDINGVLIKADATAGFKDSYGLSTTDLLRIKMGFKTLGFRAVDRNRDLSLKIEEADNKCGYRLSDLKKLSDLLYNHYYDEDKNKELKKKLSLLTHYVNKSITEGTEWLKNISVIIDLLFNSKGKEVQYSYIIMKNNIDQKEPGIIVSMKKNDEYVYFCLLKNRPIRTLTKQMISNMIDNDKLMVVNNIIEGLENESLKSLRMRKSRNGNN